MTNKERFFLYTRELPSPDMFIEFSFYYIITSALQRRVWLPPLHQPIYPNIYVILVGKPGVGKGRILSEVARFLKFYKRNAIKQTPPPNDILQAMKDAQDFMRNSGFGHKEPEKKKREDDLLIPVAADSTTLQALILAMGKNTDAVSYKDHNGQMKVYLHASTCFILEELSSLFHKHGDGVNKFLLNMYDCKDYRYDNISRGMDEIKSPCLNLIAGTSPGYMQEVFKDSILTDGFASRTFYIYEFANRKAKNMTPELDQDQLMAKQELLLHIHKLTKLFGACTYGPGVVEFIESWWEKFPTAPRANNSLKLESYYARKDLHVKKLAMAIHFSESTEKIIHLDSFHKAFELLEKAEKRMHHALAVGDRNPLSRGGKMILDYLANRPEQWIHHKELLIELNADYREEEVGEILNYLKGTEQVQQRITSNSAYEYKVIPKEQVHS